MMLDFSSIQTKLVLEGLITQTVVQFDEQSQRIVKGQNLQISFEGMPFKDYSAKIVKVTMTKLKNLTVEDIYKCGFLYKQFFYDFMQKKGFALQDTVVKIDFILEEVKE